MRVTYDVARLPDGAQRAPVEGDVKQAANEAKRRAMADPDRFRWVVLIHGTNQIAAVCWPDGGADFQVAPFPIL